jgi:hypothetical protein
MTRFRSLGGIVALLALPVLAHAQEAAFVGTVTDTTGSVLPGVTVTAVHAATGNVFETVTDATGAYRPAVRVGGYRVTAQLPGFATVVQEGLQLLVGQEATVNLQLAVSGVAESVTVTGEAPLVDVTRSAASGNIDSRQLSEIPVQGRDWQDLTMLAPGSRNNSVDQWAGRNMRGSGQLNLDGQQVTTAIVSETGDGQPSFSKDSIAEFQFITNRFDATQGRSTEMQVNVITKSGTNAFAGSAAGYFRHDRFNAADHVVGEVLPYQNQQLSSTFGGPIKRDRIHFFANYEYEREPKTKVHTTPWPAFNLSFFPTDTVHIAGVRTDSQFSPRTRLTLRYNDYDRSNPCLTCGGTNHPSTNEGQDFYSTQAYGNLTQVLGTAALNEIKVGWNKYGYFIYPIVKNPAPYAALTRQLGAPNIQLTSISFGSSDMSDTYQDIYQFRDDFTFSYTARGRHDVKMGGEYLYTSTDLYSCNTANCLGTLVADRGPVPANVEALFPVWDDPSTWNVAALNPLARSYGIGTGNAGDPGFAGVTSPRHEWGFWLQDDWRASDRLTVNLGVRYDVSKGTFAEEIELLPFLTAGRPLDKDNIAPRVGFAFALNDRTVIRGGGGLFYAGTVDQQARFTRRVNTQYHFLLLSDGRPDFATNPFNGPMPQINLQEALRTLTGRSLNQMAGSDNKIPHSYQTSIGLQRQLSGTMAVEADYVYNGGRREPGTRNINVAFNPATGANYPFTDVSRRPFPNYGNVNMWREGLSNYHALQTALTKRLSQRWQASVTYTLSFFYNESPTPVAPGCEYVYTAPGVCDVPFALPPDFGGEYTLAPGDQRHRAVFNGIFDAGYGFQLSGLYFYGSGNLLATSYGGNRRDAVGANEARLRPNNTIVPRTALSQDPIHRVDLRLQRRFGLGGSRSLDGIVEVFNAFNRANFGSYTTQESNARYGLPNQNDNVAYAPRTLQLGIRFAF